MDATKEELLRAAARARDQNFADMLIMAIGIAAETHPELIRNALAKVFDMSAVEDMSKRIMRVATEAQKLARETAADVRIISAQVDRDVKRMNDAFDEIRAKIERLRQPPRIAAR